jgi:hypothetical protein
VHRQALAGGTALQSSSRGPRRGASLVTREVVQSGAPTPPTACCWQILGGPPNDTTALRCYTYTYTASHVRCKPSTAWVMLRALQQMRCHGRRPARDETWMAGPTALGQASGGPPGALKGGPSVALAVDARRNLARLEPWREHVFRA